MSTIAKIGLGPTPNPRRLHVGDLTLTFLDGGELWLDGGAMFGIIPKPMWGKSAVVDEANRIPLAMTCTLVESDGKRILVETGCGAASKYSDKENGFFRFGNYTIIDSLAAIGLEPDAIDLVILTHLHFDHAGGGTVAVDGDKGATRSSSASAVTSGGATGSSPASATAREVAYRPTFPRAKYIVQRGEWEDAISGHVVMTGTYRPENLGPLEAAGVLSFVDGEAEVAPGIMVRPMPGHTRHQQGVVFYAGAKNPLEMGAMLGDSDARTADARNAGARNAGARIAGARNAGARNAGARNAGARIPSRTQALQESLPAHAGATIPISHPLGQESLPAVTIATKGNTWEGIPTDAGARRDSRTSGETHCAILPADMIPTAAHLGLRHNMAYDLMPYENMVNKERLLQAVARTGATLLLGQDPGCPAWRVEEKDGRFSATKVAMAND